MKILPYSCICCPCQTIHGTMEVIPGNQHLSNKSEVDWNGPLCCNWNNMVLRKVTYELAGDARGRLDALVMCSYLVASALAAMPEGGSH